MDDRPWPFFEFCRYHSPLSIYYDLIILRTCNNLSLWTIVYLFSKKNIYLSMKKYLAIIVFVLLSVCARAQNLTLSDITNLASLTNSEAHNSLTFERPFRQKYTENVNGLTIDHYEGTTPSSQAESVLIGYGDKTTNGNFLHTVTYATTNVKYLQNLITQAKSLGLTKQFQGGDASNNIYLFTNFLYSVNVYIANDNSKGSITVKQNEIR
jgi:hypothetical protein